MVFRSLPFASAALCILLGAGVASSTGACDAGNDPDGTGASAANGSNGSSASSGLGTCPRCDFDVYVDCDGNATDCADQGLVCAPTLGCAECAPGERICIGNEVHECSAEGTPNGPIIETCDVNAGLTCHDGGCKTACQIAEEQPSNVGCEFWAVDLDQQDGLNDPASADWGLALSNAGTGQANVTIEINEAPVGQPAQLTTVAQLSIPAGQLLAQVLPIRELDCGTVPNDYNSPGTCLSSRAFRVTSSSPILVYQFNVFANAYSNDASLLLPTNALGLQYRVMGWYAGHPIDVGFFGVDRSYVTVVGTKPNTTVTVRPTWKIRGNPPIAATDAGGEIQVVLNPFDVLNLETDNATFQDDPMTMTDLSGSLVFSDQPVAVFTGVETTQVPGPIDIPTYPGWTDEDTCCLDHLEEQLFPVESLGKNYVITRSPVRSTGGFKEPDVIRFVGAAEPAAVTTTLPAPFNSFTLQPGEVKTTWAQDNFTVTSDVPILVGQYLVSQGYVQGALTGDPAMTIFPPVEQYRTEYVILTPPSWSSNWVVISAEPGTNITIDGMLANCAATPAGTVNNVTYESRVCPLSTGAHAMSGDKPFGIVGYGYGGAGSYAFVGGADVKKIYEPPVPQ